MENTCCLCSNKKNDFERFIPFNLEKNVMHMFHLDNINWLEDTLDGKSTFHLL